MTFPANVVAAVLRHMNDDHTDDSLVIVRASIQPLDSGAEVLSATMTGFDERGADWTAELSDLPPRSIRVTWPGGPISERGEVRRELVAVTEAAYATLGIPFERH